MQKRRWARPDLIESGTGLALILFRVRQMCVRADNKQVHVPTFEYTRPLIWGDCDPAGVIYFLTYFRWSGEGSSHLFKSIGFPFESMRQDLGGGAPAVATQARYFVAPLMGDEIRHVVDIADVRRRSFTTRHRFYRREVLLAEITSAHAWISMAAGPDAPRQASPLPEDLAAALKS